MEVSLREARKSDEAFLLELRKTTMVPHLNLAGIFLSDEEHVLRAREGFDCAHIIEYGGHAIGMAKYRESSDRVEVLQLQVLPKYQGRGVGSEILDVLIESARRGKKSLVLTVLKENPAKRLYERKGFRVVGEDEHEFHMCLETVQPG